LSKALWKFLHDTGHPQVKGTKIDVPRWGSKMIYSLLTYDIPRNHNESSKTFKRRINPDIRPSKLFPIPLLRNGPLHDQEDAECAIEDSIALRGRF
jgi:hypothetical protein